MLKEHLLFKGHPYFVTKYTVKKEIRFKGSNKHLLKIQRPNKNWTPCSKIKKLCFSIDIKRNCVQGKKACKMVPLISKKWNGKKPMKKKNWKKAMLLDRRRSYDFRQALKKTPSNRFLRRKSPSKKRLRIDRQIAALRHV